MLLGALSTLVLKRIAVSVRNDIGPGKLGSAWTRWARCRDDAAVYALLHNRRGFATSDGEDDDKNGGVRDGVVKNVDGVKSDGEEPGKDRGGDDGSRLEEESKESLSDIPNHESAEKSIVPAGPRPENFPKVLAVPLTRRPLFPGFYLPVDVRNKKLADALFELKRQGTPYVGAFLLKDIPSNDPNTFSTTSGGSQSKPLDTLHGDELYQSMHEFGTFAQVSQVVKALDGESAQVLLMGHRRIRATGIVDEDLLTVSVDYLKDNPYNPHSDVLKATTMEVVTTLKDLMRLNPLYKEHIAMFVQHVGEFNASRMADFGAALTTADESSLQSVLEELDVDKRLHQTLMLLKKELELSKIQATIAKGVEEKISGDQRRYLLNEQLKAIKKELGLEKDDKTALIGKFRDKLEKYKDAIPENVKLVIEDELTKLQGLEASSNEFSVTRNYLDWLTSIPWGQYSEENFDVRRAQKVLDADHYGLSDVKERILEFIAVGRLRGSAQGKIICLVGPPGVGKTSIGKSIASALNRKFHRFSVGGLSDVAEIKGHRRTYVGAMPGKIVQSLKSVGTSNPLVLIDEIDKLGRGHAGDPASALLELLDPEQNSSFLDHYLDVPVDLSKVLFVCTANVLDTIPGPLLDRMEVIRLVGYITDEKMHIAKKYLHPTSLKNSGLVTEQIEITDNAFHALIETYCREAGVRNLQKHIEKIHRKVALKLVRHELESKALDKEAIDSPNEGEKILKDSQPEETSPQEAIVQKILDGQEEDKEALDIALQLTETEPTSTVPVEHPLPDKKLAEVAEAEEEKLSDGSLQHVEKIVVDENNLVEYAGNPVFQNEKLYEQTPVGVVMGLAWTALGGSTLYVESSLIEEGKEKGSMNLTGQLGDVMKESASIALTLSRKILRQKDPTNDFFSTSRIHVHVPAGATPKDGPSAGCTMVTSLLSLAMNQPVIPDFAMTGEVTLTGRVLPIGGVKEKTIASRRCGVKTIVFPKANKKDFDELPEYVKEGLEVHFVETYDEIFDLAFGKTKGL